MQQILNDKFGLSYLSGNAQYLYANTATTQNFDTIIANTFTQYSNVFTINTSGVYGLSFTTDGNISGANIIISGNLYLKEGFGDIGQFITRTATGVGWSTATFSGGTITNPLIIASSAPSTTLTSGALIVRGGAAVWGNIYANSNVVLTGSNVAVSNLQIGSGWNTASFRSNANLILANAAVLNATSANIGTLVAANLTSANGTITGTSSGIGAFKTSAVSNNWTVSPIGNVYATYGNINNFQSANGAIYGSSSGIGAFKTAATSNNWTINPIGNVYATYGNINNFQSANGAIYGSSSGIGSFRTAATSNNWTVNAIGNVYATYGLATNFSSSNVVVTGGYLTGLANLQTGVFSYTASVVESLTIAASLGGTQSLYLGTGSTFYYNSVTASWTPNVSYTPFIPLSSIGVSKSISFSLILVQGATPYSAANNDVIIDNVAYTVKWASGVTPTASTNRTEIYFYSCLNTGGTWVVLGSSAYHT